jgi:ribosomal protein S18 acetylase RimI-like enzyme
MTRKKKMNILRATQEDAEKIAAIVRESHRDVAQMFNLTLENNPKHPSFCTQDWVLSDFQRGEEYFLYKAENTLAGCVAFEQPDPETGYLNRLSVRPPYRRQGIGAALVDHIIAYAQTKKVQIISIGIIADHEILKNWYANLGFIEKETRYFEHLPFDVTYMHYEL